MVSAAISVCSLWFRGTTVVCIYVVGENATLPPYQVPGCVEIPFTYAVWSRRDIGFAWFREGLLNVSGNITPTSCNSTEREAGALTNLIPTPGCLSTKKNRWFVFVKFAARQLASRFLFHAGRQTGITTRFKPISRSLYKYRYQLSPVGLCNVIVYNCSGWEGRQYCCFGSWEPLVILISCFSWTTSSPVSQL